MHSPSDAFKGKRITIESNEKKNALAKTAWFQLHAANITNNTTNVVFFLKSTSHAFIHFTFDIRAQLHHESFSQKLFGTFVESRSRNNCVNSFD